MNMKLMASEKYFFSRTFLIRKPSPLVNKHRAIAHKKRSQQPVIGEGRWGSSYLSNRKQRVKIGSTFSDWHYISSGVPQGSILGPLLFNVYINDLLLCIEKSGICSFADDDTLYASGDNIGDVATCLEVDIENVLKWFDSNRMVANLKNFK